MAVAPKVVLTLPDGTDLKSIFNLLKKLAVSKKQLSRVLDDSDWAAHKLLSDSLLAGAPDTTKQDLLAEALKPAEDTLVNPLNGTNV